MKKSIAILFLALSVYGCGQGNQKANHSKYLDSQALPIIEAFFNNIQSGRYLTSVNELLSKNENIDLNDSLTIQLQKKFNYINEQSGKFISKRLLRKKNLGEDIGVYSYLVKYDKKFYRFFFLFYNNETSVKIFKFSFDDNIDIELEEAIKLYID